MKPQPGLRSRVAPVQRPVAIDARAAVRPELGGVERWARELAARLPRAAARRLRRRAPAAGARAPGRARVGAAACCRRHRARAARCCARRTSRRWPRATSSSCSTTPPPCATRVVLARLRDLAASAPARILPAAPARVVTVSEFSRAELARAARRRCGAVTVVPGGVDERFTPDADRSRPGARSASPGPTCCASPRTRARKNLAALRPAARALAAEGVELVVAGGRPAPVRRRGRPAACGSSARSPTTAPRPVRRRRGVRAPVALRGLRPARARGDGRRRPWSRPRRRAAADLRRAPRLVAPATRRRSARALLDLLGDAGDERARLRAAGPRAGERLLLGGALREIEFWMGLLLLGMAASPLTLRGRTALVHDFLLDMRGAERVFAAICDVWPDADVFTAVYDEQAPRGDSPRARQHVVPAAARPTARTFRALLPLYPYAIESLDLRGYDIVISCSSAWAHGVLVDPGAVHVCYCHNPFRYAWNEREATLAARGPLVRAALRVLLARWRQWDWIAAQRVDRYVANSAHDRRAHAALLRPRADGAAPAGRARPLRARAGGRRLLRRPRRADGAQAHRRRRAGLQPPAPAAGGRRRRAGARAACAASPGRPSASRAA